MSKTQLKKSSLKRKLRKIKKNNGYEYDCLKAIEELTELAAVLTQSLTKSKQATREHTHEEFGDVKFRLGVLENYYDSEVINRRVEAKLTKSIGYLKSKKYDKV